MNQKNATETDVIRILTKTSNSKSCKQLATKRESLTLIAQASCYDPTLGRAWTEARHQITKLHLGRGQTQAALQTHSELL
jgi:hypothetical protein